MSATKRRQPKNTTTCPRCLSRVMKTRSVPHEQTFQCTARVNERAAKARGLDFAGSWWLTCSRAGFEIERVQAKSGRQRAVSERAAWEDVLHTVPMCDARAVHWAHWLYTLARRHLGASLIRTGERAALVRALWEAERARDDEFIEAVAAIIQLGRKPPMAWPQLVAALARIKVLGATGAP